MELQINTENDAFRGEEGAIELARIIRSVAGRIAAGESEGILRDCNGNSVGRFDATDMERTDEEGD